MSDPTRIGGARGPAGRTLSDLYDQLGGIATGLGALPDMATNVAQLAGDMQRLVGPADPQDWSGLSQFLGDRSSANGITLITGMFEMAIKLNELSTISTRLEIIERNILRLNDYIVGTGEVPPGRGEDFYALLAAMRDFINTMNGNTTASKDYLNEINANAAFAKGYLNDINANTNTSRVFLGDINVNTDDTRIKMGTIEALTQAIHDNFGQNTGDATTTLLGLLGSVQYALTQNPAAFTTLYSMIRAMTQSLTLPANIDNTVLGELDALRVQTTLTNTILRPTGPTDCANPFVSNAIAFSGGSFEILGVALTSPVTFAVWPTSTPSGLTISNNPAFGNIVVSAADWSQWQIYVASRACSFGVILTSSQRFDTNKWITLSGDNDFRFFVDGNDCIDVYLCGGVPYIIGGGSPPVDVCSPAANGVQWSGFVQRGTEIISFQERPVFAGVFSAAPAPFTVDSSTVGAWDLYTLTGAQQLLMCLSWDFSTAPAAPIAFTLITAVQSAPDGSNWGNSDPVTLGDMTKGCATYSLDNAAFGNGDFERFYFAFAFPVGTVPGGVPANVWLSVGT